MSAAADADSAAAAAATEGGGGCCGGVPASAGRRGVEAPVKALKEEVSVLKNGIGASFDSASGMPGNCTVTRQVYCCIKN